jgi:hypothetical protein
VRVDRVEPLVVGAGGEDVGTPLHEGFAVAKSRCGADKEALELDVDSELLARFALHAALELLTRLHAAPGRPPRARRVGRLLDERKPTSRVEDEERDVVSSLR